jgi:dTDP-glucose 4,6-dehydratase
VNIGNPHEMTILQFAQAVQREVGSQCPIRHEPLPQDDPRVRRPDISRAREVLGWEPKVPFDEGLRRSVAWFRERVRSEAPVPRALP